MVLPDVNLQSAAATLLPFVGGFAGSLVQRRNMDVFYKVEKSTNIEATLARQ